MFRRVDCMDIDGAGSGALLSVNTWRRRGQVTPICVLTLCAAWAATGAAAEAAATPAAMAQLLYPRNGTLVTVGKMVVVDIVPSAEAAVAGWYVCLRTATSAPWACFDDPDTLQLTATRVGEYELHAALSHASRHDPGTTAATAAEELNRGQAPRWYDVTRWSAVPVDFCAHGHRRNSGGNGTSRCGDIPSHCTSMGRFRYFLYPVTYAPTLHSAAIYSALADSPFRTLVPEAACVFITATDVRVANYAADSAFTSARRLTRLPHWGTSGARHLVFDYADYGAWGWRGMGGTQIPLPSPPSHFPNPHATAPPYDTGLAMLARSSYGRPLDRAAIRPDSPDSLPDMQPYRPGHDLIIPMAFYR